MKLNFSCLLFVLLFLLGTTNLSAVVAVQPEHAEKEIAKEKALEAYKKLSPRQQRKLKKRMAKLQRKGKLKKAADVGFVDNSKFRLGALIFAGGLVLLLLYGLFIGFGGFIAWIGGLATFVGFILMIWALIEYYG